MSVLVLSALALSVAVAAVAWLAGVLAERRLVAPGPRLTVWTAALLAPTLAAGFTLVGAAVLAQRPELVVFALPTDTLPPNISTIDPTANPSLETLAAAVLLALGAGTLVQLLRLASRAIALRRVLSRSSAAPAELVSRLGVAGSPVSMRLTDALDQPVLVGLFRPTLLLPRAWVGATPPETLRRVCAHELAHARRGDHRAVWAEAILLALFCFSPPLRAIRARLAAAREEACDVQALRGATPEDRRLYGLALLNALRPAARPELALSFGGEGRSLAMRRLNAIESPRPAPPAATRLAAGLLAAGLTLLSLGAATSVASAQTETRVDPPARRVMVMRCDQGPEGQPINCRTTAGEPVAQPRPSGGQTTFTMRCRRGPGDAPEDCTAERSDAAALTAVDYQARCAQPEDGLCAGVLFGLVAAERQREQPAFCPPDPQSDSRAIVDRARPLVQGATPAAGESGPTLARRALAQAFPCPAATARTVIMPRATVSLDGATTSPAALAALDPARVTRVEVLTAGDGRVELTTTRR